MGIRCQGQSVRGILTALLPYADAVTAPGAGDSGDAAPDALDGEFTRRLEEIRAMGNHYEAYMAARELTKQAGRFRGEAARLRTEMARRLKEAEGLSVGQLGNRIGVEKPTAQKILGRKPDA
jgi:hypothetical protein